jgi:hypothetical protein
VKRNKRHDAELALSAAIARYQNASYLARSVSNKAREAQLLKQQIVQLRKNADNPRPVQPGTLRLVTAHGSGREFDPGILPPGHPERTA